MVIKMDEEQTSIKKFASWLDLNEKKLDAACHCAQEQNWNNVIDYHKSIQSEVEESGLKIMKEVKEQLNDKSSQKDQWVEFSGLEKRWHKLWIKSLEQLVIVERSKRCPKHNLTIIGKPLPTSPANKRHQRRRPVSYPNNASERLEWDYQNTLSLTGCHKENGSQIDLDSVDEQVTRNLTEFGENYEVWFGKEDEVAVHSRPPSCGPTDPPEIAKAIVTSEDVNCNLLMLTTPSSMLSVDATKCCNHNEKKWRNNQTRRLFCSLILLFALILLSTFYNEPHHMYKSYHHSQPPV